MAGFGGVVWSSIPAGRRRNRPGIKAYTPPYQQTREQLERQNGLRCSASKESTPLTSWASDHQQQIQKEIHGAGARRHLPLQLCALWRWSLHPPLCLLLEQHLYPTSKWSLKKKNKGKINKIKIVSLDRNSLCFPTSIPWNRKTFLSFIKGHKVQIAP